MLSSGWGGAERLFVELCSGLAEKGHDVLVICNPGFAHGSPLKHQANVKYICIPTVCNWDYFSVLLLKHAVKKYKPDLIHAHLSRASWMAGLAGKATRTPVVSTTHNRIKQKYIADVDFFITITDELGSYLSQLAITASRIEKIPNFSLVPPVNTISALCSDPLVFIAIGRFVQKKGFDVLLKAFKEYADTSPVSARLRLAGDGPLGNELRMLATQLGIGDLVEFTGWVDDIVSFYDSGDIFVLPSRDEPFGIVLLEAMARGKAVIATNIGGPRDFLTNETAFLVQPEDILGLSCAMREAATETELRASKSVNALDLYRTKYTKESVLPKFVAFFEYIAKSGKTLC
jgi:glycosyltransferase involved in cell wall biosynthesis